MHFWCRIIVRCCGEKTFGNENVEKNQHVCQWKCWKTLLFGTLFAVLMSNNCTLLWRRSRQWRGVCNWVSQSLPWGGAMNIALVQCCFLLFFCRYTDLPQMMRFVSRQWRGICKWVLQSLLWSVLPRTCSSTNVVFRVIIAMVVLSTTCPSTCVGTFNQSVSHLVSSLVS